MNPEYLDDELSEQETLPGMKYKQGIWKPISFIANVFGISEQAVRNWIAAGIIDKPVNRELNLFDVIRRVYLHQRTLIEAGGSRGMSNERQGLLKAKRGIEELRFEEMRGRLVDIEDVRRSAFSCGKAVADALESLPSRVSAILSAERDENTINKILTVELNKIRRDTLENLQDKIT